MVKSQGSSIYVVTRVRSAVVKIASLEYRSRFHATQDKRFIGFELGADIATATDLDDIRMHGKDERMAVADFYDGLEFEYQLIKAISSERK